MWNSYKKLVRLLKNCSTWADDSKPLKEVVAIGRSYVTHGDIAEPQVYKRAEDKAADKVFL